jgi:hypothetical protein
VTTIDLTPLIIADLDDLIRGRSLANPEDADLLALADGLSLATDHIAIASIKVPEDLGVDLERIADEMTGERPPVDAAAQSGWHLIAPVARHLATVAASLCARGMTYRREAEALWRASSRLLGMEDVPDQSTAFNRERMELTAAFATEWAHKNPDVSVEAMPEGTLRMTLKTDPTNHVDLADPLLAELQAAHTRIANLQAEAASSANFLNATSAELSKARAEIDRLKRTHADDERALVEAHARELRTETEKRVSIANAMSSVIRERDEAAKEVADLRSRLSLTEAAVRLLEPTKTIERPGPLRDILLKDTCHEATLYLGPAPGDLRVVVVLRDGKTLDDVQRVLAECGRPAGTCSLREVGTNSSFQRETDAIAAQISGKG